MRLSKSRLQYTKHQGDAAFDHGRGGHDCACNGAGKRCISIVATVIALTASGCASPGPVYDVASTPPLASPTQATGVAPTQKIALNPDDNRRQFRNCVDSYIAQNITQNDTKIIDGVVKLCAPIVITYSKNQLGMEQKPETWTDYTRVF